MGVSGHSFVRPLKIFFYLCEYVTTSKTVDIILQPIDQGSNVQSSRKVSLHSPENECFKLWNLEKLQICDAGACFWTPIIQRTTDF